jgi:hypothetical protein
MLPHSHHGQGHARRIGPLVLIVIVLVLVIALHVVGASFLLIGGFGGLVLGSPIFDAVIGLLGVIAVFHILGSWRSRAKPGRD